MEFTLWHLLAAYLLDLAVGDPPWLPHPVRLVGKLIERLERVFYAEGDPPGGKRRAGAALWVSVVAVAAGAAFLFLALCAAVHPLLWHAGAVWLAVLAYALRIARGAAGQPVMTDAAGEFALELPNREVDLQVSLGERVHKPLNGAHILGACLAERTGDW